eukprot:Hpha_TRINITY_DN32089_c0_g1::TRINITY_DN32089_c0_g1_i1::g.115818::m.115818
MEDGEDTALLLQGSAGSFTGSFRRGSTTEYFSRGSYRHSVHPSAPSSARGSPEILKDVELVDEVELEVSFWTPSVLGLFSESFFGYISVSMIAPLLPHHLEAVGLPGALSPFVFVAHPIAMLAAAVPVNAALAQRSRSTVFRNGLLVAGLSTVLFAVAPWFVLQVFGDPVRGRFLDLALLMLARVGQGVGTKAAQVSLLSAVTDECMGDDARLSWVMAWNEIVIGGSFTLGPLVGGVLYELGGFTVPFGIASAPFFIMVLALPDLAIATSTHGAHSHGLGAAGRRMKEVLSRPTALATATMITMVQMYFGILDSGSWTVHAEGPELGLSPTMIGVCLSLPALGYNVSGLVVARLTERFRSLTLVIMGSVGLGAAMLFLGPFAATISWWMESTFGVGAHTARVTVESTFIVCGGCSGAFILVPALPAMKGGARGTPRSTEAVVSVLDAALNIGIILGPMLGASMVAGSPGSDYFAIGMGVLGCVVLANAFLQELRVRLFESQSDTPRSLIPL